MTLLPLKCVKDLVFLVLLLGIISCILEVNNTALD